MLEYPFASANAGAEACYPFVDESLAVVNPFEDAEAGGPLWSYSRLNCYAQCPRQYFLRYERRIREPDSKAAQFGRAVHDVINRSLLMRQSGSVVPVKVLAEHFVGGASMLSEEDAEEVAALAAGFLDRFAPQGRFLTEERYVAEIAGVRVQAYLDLVEDLGHAVRITDFKTEWKPYHPTERMQLPVYARVVEGVFHKPVIMRYWFLRYKRQAVKEQEFTPEVRAAAEEWVADLTAEIGKARGFGEEAFPARPGEACGVCGLGLACLGFDQTEPETTPHAERLAAVLLRLERAKESAAEALKAWVKEKGPVKVGEEWFGFYSRSSWKVTDLKRFVEILREAGKDPYGILRPESRRLRECLADPDLAAVLREVLIEEKDTYFSHRDQSPD